MRLFAPEWLMSGTVQKLVIVITNVDTNKPVERCVRILMIKCIRLKLARQFVLKMRLVVVASFCFSQMGV